MTKETRSPNGEEPTTQSFVIWSFVLPSGFVIRISSFDDISYSRRFACVRRSLREGG